MRIVTVASLIALTAIPALLGGCAIAPKALTVEATDYETVRANSKNLVASYYLQGSRLDIEFQPADAKKAATFTVASAAAEDTTHRLLLVSQRDLLSRTNLSVTKRPDSDMLSSVGSELVDNRTALITNVGTVLKTVIPLAALVNGDKPPEPLRVSWSSLDAHPGFNAVAGATEPRGGKKDGQIWRYGSTDLTVEVGPTPVTAERYSNALFAGQKTGLFAATCRSIIVRYTSQGVDYSYRGKIADPSQVEFVPLPAKGKIEFHDHCGVSVTSEKDSVATPDAIAATAATTAVAVLDSYKKANP